MKNYYIIQVFGKYIIMGDTICRILRKGAYNLCV